MYSLCSGLSEWLWPSREYKILCIGIDGAGKSSILERIRCVYQALPKPDLLKDPPKPTMGLDMVSVLHRGTELTFWDVGGAASLRPLWESYYDACHMVLFVVDVSRPDRISEQLHVAQRLWNGEDKLRNVPMVIVFTKTDALDSDQLDAKRAFEAFQDVAKTEHAGVSKEFVLSSVASEDDRFRELTSWIFFHLDKNARVPLKSDADGL
eukprot:ANDGO_02097.mRNA.1 ADP-ribosylation factor-like protein 3